MHCVMNQKECRWRGRYISEIKISNPMRNRHSAGRNSAFPLHAESLTVWQPGTPRLIELSITASHIGDISALTGTCTARLWIDVRWLPSNEELQHPEGGSAWDPAVNFQLINATETKKNEVIQTPSLKQVGQIKKWHCVVELEGIFAQHFNLRYFPLDCQSLVVRTEMGNIKAMRYVAVEHQDTVLSVEQSLCPLTGWNWLGAGVSFTGSSPKLSKQGNSYSQLVVEFKLARQWQPFVWRIVLFVAMLLNSSLLVFGMDPISDFSDRLGFLFTLLLTLVAFEYSIQDLLPAVPYITLLESYMLGCTLWIFAVVVETGAVKMLPHILSHEVDTVAFHASAWLLISVHILGMAHCVRMRRYEVHRTVSKTPSAPRKNLKVSKQNQTTVDERTTVPALTFVALE